MKCIGGRREVQSQGGRRGGVFSRAVHGIVSRSCLGIPSGGGGYSRTDHQICEMVGLGERIICFF